MHGADRDIMWLQRDFRVYVCNLFDTGQVLLKIGYTIILDCDSVCVFLQSPLKPTFLFAMLNLSLTSLSNTNQASRVLQMERNSLEHLLHHFCGVTANKMYISLTPNF